MGDVADIKSFFPLPEFRPNQEDAILEIDSALKEKKYVLVEAPTGSGKSPLAATFANQFKAQGKGAHILTVQKILQDQYARDFPDYGCQKGKGAYICSEDSTNCAEGICNRLPKDRKQQLMANCPYRRSIAANREKPVVVHNFDSFYYQKCLARQFPERDLLIIDEAHNIEDKFIDFFSFTLHSNSKMRESKDKFPKFEIVSDYVELVKQERYEIATRMYALIKNEDQTLDSDTYKLVQSMEQTITKLDSFLHKCLTTEYVFDIIDHPERNSIVFRPVFAGPFVGDVLFSGPLKVLMLSATVLDYAMFCENIGLDPADVAYIEIPSTFPAKHRPIIAKYAGSMSFSKIRETLPQMVTILQSILEKMGSYRGIIHTGSERVAEYIRENLRDPRLTFRKDYYTVNDLLDAHMKKPNSVIVASGLKEGVDLKDALSRFQVIVKVPYLDLSDKRTKRRMTLDKSWYGYQSAKLFIQSVGRSVRSPTDKAITYVTDSSFIVFYNMNKRFIPRYIKDALHL